MFYIYLLNTFNYKTTCKADGFIYLKRYYLFCNNLPVPVLVLRIRNLPSFEIVISNAVTVFRG